MTTRTTRSQLAGPHKAGIAACLVLAALAISIFALTGCGTFFIKGDTGTTGSTGSTGTSGTTGSASTDFAYFGNSSSSTQSVNGFLVSSGALSANSGSPYALGFVPQAMVMNRADNILWASNGAGSIYAWSISTSGVLTLLNNGQAVAANEYGYELEVSPDGLYLFSINNLLGYTIDQYTIGTNGTLQTAGNYPITGSPTGGTVVPTGLKFAPSGQFIVATLGTGGADVFSYSQNVLSPQNGGAYITLLNPPANSSVGFYGVDIDSSNRIYIASTNSSNPAWPGLHVYTCTSAGVATEVASANTGNGPRSVVANAAGTFVYVANYSDSSISAFSIDSSNNLAPLATTATYPAPTNVLSLARDNTGNYLMAAGYNGSSGYQIFSIGSSGALSSMASSGSGTSTTNGGLSYAAQAIIAAAH